MPLVGCLARVHGEGMWRGCGRRFGGWLCRMGKYGTTHTARNTLKHRPQRHCRKTLDFLRSANEIGSETSRIIIVKIIERN